MADKNFVVKNGIVVNTAFSANASGVYFSGNLLANSSQVNATTFTGTANNSSYLNNKTEANLNVNSSTTALTANNSSYLGGTIASGYQTTAGLSANIASYLPTYGGVVNGSSINIGTAWTANSTKIVIGYTVGVQANGSLGSANQVLTSNGSAVYWANGGGTGSTYTKGNAGAVGDPSAANNIFRVNANTVSNNITFNAQDNASATGPITVAEGYTISISDGGRVVII